MKQLIITCRYESKLYGHVQDKTSTGKEQTLEDSKSDEDMENKTQELSMFKAVDSDDEKEEVKEKNEAEGGEGNNGDCHTVRFVLEIYLPKKYIGSY